MFQNDYRYPGLAVLAILLLRLNLGVHFYFEGIKKLDGFSAEGFLLAAKGPLAPSYQAFAKGPHDWRRLLASPRPLYADQASGAVVSSESASKDWRARIEKDWGDAIAAFASAAKLGEDAQADAQGAMKETLSRLDAYLTAEESAIADYRHELWRLRKLQSEPGAYEIDYAKERINEKSSETRTKPLPWVAEVQAMEKRLFAQVEALAGERNQIPAAALSALRPTTPLDMVNTAVTWTVISVGVMLFLGLATPVAALVGAAFLLSVMSTQPPWVEGALTEFAYYQAVEIAALLTVAATGAGRWAGLDGVFNTLVRCCRAED